MANAPCSPSRTPLIKLSDDDQRDLSMDQMDTNRWSEPDNSATENPGQQAAFPTYGTVRVGDQDEEQAPYLEEKPKKKNLASSVVSLSSFTDLFTKEGYSKLEDRKKNKKYDYEDDDDSDNEAPPLFEFHFRRNTKDKVKLVVLPILYFLFMVIAIVFGFYTIEALVYSYQNKVRSVKYVTVEKYRTIGIAMFPQDFAVYEGCRFIYSDDLLPRSGNAAEINPGNLTCQYTNVTFKSQLTNANRTAMVFDGPTLVNLKQSLALNFTIDTTEREFSGMEYLLLENWDRYKNGPPENQAHYLSRTEQSMPLYTIPAGFRSWIKMSLTVLSETIDNENISNFMVDPGFSTFNDWRNISDRTTDIIYVLFEWKSNTYEYVKEILSTNIYNTLGALAGVFVTLAKAGEYCWQWIRRIRRERRKKKLKHSELAEQHRQKMQEYQQKKLEKRLKKLQSASVLVEQ